MKRCYVQKRFSAESIERIRQANSIVETYMEAGLKLTLRQLYYQFVAHYALPNTEKSYKNLASLISNARLAGLLDWSAIEDRGRVPDSASEFEDIPDLLAAAMRSYRLDRWEGQDMYAELWVEKQALAGVLWPLASEFHVTLMVNKGYSSQSAMHDAALRFISRTRGGKDGMLFYLGDHYPSGEDMVRDIRDRLATFGVRHLEVRKLALTMDQIEEHRPPPNPAKVSDSRFEAYAAKHGDESWELDALDPTTLSEIIREAFAGIVNQPLMDAVKAREELHKNRLLKATKSVNWDK